MVCCMLLWIQKVSWKIFVGSWKSSLVEAVFIPTCPVVVFEHYLMGWTNGGTYLGMTARIGDFQHCYRSLNTSLPINLFTWIVERWKFFNIIFVYDISYSPAARPLAHRNIIYFKLQSLGLGKFLSPCIISALMTSGNAYFWTAMPGYNDDARPSIISHASAALMKEASNFTLCLQAR